MKSAVTRDKKRRALFKEYEEKRLALKSLQRLTSQALFDSKQNQTKVDSLKKVEEIQIRIQQGLNELPHNSSKVRIRNRCVLTGRARAVWRSFRISRIQLRKLALEGVLIGVKRSSW
jgi:small subunit ribosomal protein S14